MVREASVTFSPARVSMRASAALKPEPAPTISALLNSAKSLSAISILHPGAADLKFLHHLPQSRPGTSNRKAALESYSC